ncbi:unnamed protein product [Ectocarpus fasciculatus]
MVSGSAWGVVASGRWLRTYNTFIHTCFFFCFIFRGVWHMWARRASNARDAMKARDKFWCAQTWTLAAPGKVLFAVRYGFGQRIFCVSRGVVASSPVVWDATRHNPWIARW